MSDFPDVFESLLDSEQAAALVKVHPKTLQRYARRGLVVGLRMGKMWRFRASDLIPPRFEREGQDLDEDAQAQYAESNHSCPQPDRR